MIEPYACSFHCVDRAQVKTTDVVVQSGVGTLGLGMVGALRQANPKLLIVLDMNDARLEKAKEFGADLVMNSGKEDVVAKIKELTDWQQKYTFAQGIAEMIAWMRDHMDAYKADIYNV